MSDVSHHYGVVVKIFAAPVRIQAGAEVRLTPESALKMDHMLCMYPETIKEAAAHEAAVPEVEES